MSDLCLSGSLKPGESTYTILSNSLVSTLKVTAYTSSLASNVYSSVGKIFFSLPKFKFYLIKKFPVVLLPFPISPKISKWGFPSEA